MPNQIKISPGFRLLTNFLFFCTCKIFLQCTCKSKDHIEKIDFQELIFAVINWPNSEFYGAIVSIIRYFGLSATSPLANVFLAAGWGVLQILIQNTRFYRVKQGPMGYLFIKEIKKVQNKNLHNYSNIPTPLLYQTDASCGGGGDSHCAVQQTVVRSMQKWPVVGNSFH